MSDDKTFHLAITMAGAISAGAYTAGVIDYLFEVLEKWEKMKNDEQFKDLVPRHKVVIEVMSGASAGGMTACIASLAVQRKLRPIAAYHPKEASYDDVSDAELKERKEENRLYNSWVNLTADDMIPQLLKTDDLTDVTKSTERTFISGLNSRFIKRIANKTLILSTQEPLEWPSFVSPHLRTFVTLTNLDGFKKETKFAGASSGFFTYDHRDVAFFSFDHVDSSPFDGSIDVDFNDETENGNTDLFVTAGMATGAFPVGLAYRTFSRHKKYVENNILLTKLNDGKKIILSSNDVIERSQYKATFIDGGTIDNEPFELTEYLLKTRVNASGQEFVTKTPESFNSTVLMVDPFPSEERERIRYNRTESPFSVIGAIARLFSTVRTQSLLKREDLEKVVSKRDSSCFMISPRRREAGYDPIDGSLAIACGSLNGFGGFLDKDFRKHDFYLGRINCKSFLQKHFSISHSEAKENPIFAESYGESDKNQKIRDLFRSEVLDNEGNVIESNFPIIPDVNLIDDKLQGREINDLYFALQFPTLSEAVFRSRFRKYEKGIKTRLKMIIQSNIKDYSSVSFYAGFGLLFGGGKAVSEILNYIINELKRWKIIRSDQV
ncbi:MAG TPA: patatin-like phospholipase family protein [Pyrinomonadaceae bacterium]|nr:patatin-like phospholipase family protein [Pyrinomonadaceae bacterium]